MTWLRRITRRTRLAYQVRCAREDIRRRNLARPVGVWFCERCMHVSLSQPAFAVHLRAAHA